MISNNNKPSNLKETVINGYEIQMSLKESILHINAENISSLKVYSATINQSDIEKLTY